MLSILKMSTVIMLRSFVSVILYFLYNDLAGGCRVLLSRPFHGAAKAESGPLGRQQHRHIRAREFNAYPNRPDTTRQ